MPAPLNGDRHGPKGTGREFKSINGDGLEFAEERGPQPKALGAIADSLGIPSEKAYTNIRKYGNTSAASVPILLHETLQAGRIQRGDLCLLAAFGTGFNWGASLLYW